MFLNSPESISDLKQGIQEAKIDTARKQDLLNQIDQAVEEAKVESPEEKQDKQLKQQQLDELEQQVQSGQIDYAEANQMLEQIQNGTYQQHRNLEQIASEQSQEVEQALQSGQIAQEQANQEMEALNNTLVSGRERINTPQTAETTQQQPTIYNAKDESYNLYPDMLSVYKQEMHHMYI